MPATSVGIGDLRVLLRTERPLGDCDIGKVILPLAEILAGAEEEPTVKAGEPAVGHLPARVASCLPRRRGCSVRHNMDGRASNDAIQGAPPPEIGVSPL